MSTADPSLRSVTFVGHDASRTGAPMLLASSLRWATRNVADSTDMSLVLLDGGPLLEEYRRVMPTQLVGGLIRKTAIRLASAARSVGLAADPLDRAADRVAWVSVGDVVVANTLVALPFASRMAARRRPDARLVCHVCELDGVADRVLPEGPVRDDAVRAVDRFIATGEAVAEMLVERWGIPARRVTALDPWLDPRRVAESLEPHSGTADPGSSSLFCDAFPREIPRKRITEQGVARPMVLAVGSMRHRKGPDRFVDLISLLATHPSRPIGVWLGDLPGSAVSREVRDDVDRSIDPGSIELVADVEDIAPLVAAADVVVSTAIEDPFSLVVLEAAAERVPVAGFSSGGIRDALAAVDQLDALVPVDDVIGLARVVSRLLDDPNERRRRGSRLFEWLQQTHLVEHIAPRWWDAVVG